MEMMRYSRIIPEMFAPGPVAEGAEPWKRAMGVLEMRILAERLDEVSTR